MTTRGKKILIGTILVVILILIYFFASRASTETFENLGLHMPLPLFTILISFVDGWNPCTLWMLTFILGVLVSIAHNRARVFIVGFSFVAVVFVFYYLFMAAWLNIYLLLGYIRIIRVIIAILAIVMGLINCKDFFFYKQGVSLIIPEGARKRFIHRMDKIRGLIVAGSLATSILASIVLAGFASIVELPCTAGFPVIYTNILAEKGFDNNLGYYFYLLLYNMVYVIQESTLVIIFGFFFAGKRSHSISEKQVQWLKLAGGIIMLALGIILLVNPNLLNLVK